MGFYEIKHLDEVYFAYDDIIIINGDFLKVNLPLNFVDLIVTSPPYNIDIKYKSYRDSIPYSEYLN